MKIPSACAPILLVSLLAANSAAAVETDPLHRSSRKDNPTAKEVALEREWMATDRLSAAALKAYIDKRPRGSRYKEALVLLPVMERLETIMKGGIKPAVAIPFAEFKEDWKITDEKGEASFSYCRPQGVRTEKGGLWIYKRLDFEELGSFSPGKFGDLTFSRWDGQFKFGHGSVVAFDTAGYQCPLKDRAVIVSDKGNIVYFGIIKDLGVVHLAGKGQAILRDGKIVKFH